MNKTISIVAVALAMLTAPGMTLSETITIEKVTAEVQPVSENEFQIFIEFELTDILNLFDI